MKQRAQPDTVIVGGGIIGLMTARALVRAGAKVRLIDKSPAVEESSWAGAGVLSPLKPWKARSATAALTRGAGNAYRRLARQLAEETGMDTGFSEGGMVFLCGAESGFARWAGSVQSRGVWLSHSQLRRRMGALTPVRREGFWLPDSPTLRPPRFCRALLQWLKMQPNFTVAEPQQALALERKGGAVAQVHTRAGSHSAERYVIAAGAWTAQLVPELAGHLYPLRGQIVAYRTGHARRPVTVSAADGYAVVRPDGLALVGSTVESAGFDRRPTEAGYRRLVQCAGRMLPALAGLQPGYHWAGLRPGAVSPLIGQVPGCDNLWVNTGHFTEGFACAPAAADLCAALLSGAPPALNPAPYDPSGLTADPTAGPKTAAPRA